MHRHEWISQSRQTRGGTAAIGRKYLELAGLSNRANCWPGHRKKLMGFMLVRELPQPKNAALICVSSKTGGPKIFRIFEALFCESKCLELLRHFWCVLIHPKYRQILLHNFCIWSAIPTPFPSKIPKIMMHKKVPQHFLIALDPPSFGRNPK